MGPMARPSSLVCFSGLFTDGPAAELHLKSGMVLKGTSFGAHGVEMSGELVFNTGT